MSNIVAIVGRPNVGKSTLFNRIIKERLSIVEDIIGVTRDRIYAYGEWLTKKFALIDTGGITSSDIPFKQEIKMQAEIAINEAEIIMFVLSYKDGLTDDDKMISKILYKSNKKVILVLNKYDNKIDNSDIYEYMKLGFGVPLLVSSAHGIGIGDLLDKTIASFANETNYKDHSEVKFSIIGKPNVGKSSLVNAILNENRVIVSSIPGTTTDSIDSKFTYNKKKYIAIDTAGIRRKGKIYEKIEKYSLIRSLNSIEKSDIVVLLLDGSEKISDLDTNIGGIAFSANKPVIIVINKIDLLKSKENEYKIWEKKIQKSFKYLSYSYFIFVSALKKDKINKLLVTINMVYQLLQKRIRTSILNEILVKAQLLNPSPDFKGGRLKIYYSAQPKTMPPTFILFVNDKNYVHFSYYRYIENQIRDSFGFKGVPIKLIFRSKK